MVVVLRVKAGPGGGASPKEGTRAAWPDGPPPPAGWSYRLRRIRGRGRATLIGVMCAALVAGGLTAVPAQAAPKPGPGMPGAEARSRVPKPGPVREADRAPADRPLPKGPTARPVHPPAAGAASAAVDAAFRRVGGLPVSVAAAGGQPAAGSPAGGQPAAGSPVGSAARVDVATLDPAVVDRIGGRSIGFQVRRRDGAAVPGPVSVRVDTSSIADQYGGGFAARLRLVRYPGCVLSAPADPACATPTPVVSTADPVARQVTATVEAGPDLAASAVPTAAFAVYALASTSGPSEAGSYKATPLKASDAWAVGEQSGSFTYSYPLPAAPSTGGDAPSLALSYDSGSVDGLTSKENHQSSPVGLGWDLGVPFVEHRMAPCTQSDIVGNQCWAGRAYTVSLNGHASALTFKETTDGNRDQYRMQDDQGWQVEMVREG